MSADKELTPMMAQYRRIKSELPKDALLMFRLGDFYEMFFEDAQQGAQLLNVALTKRGVVPMCGIPFHAMNGYI
ncbi:MAG: mutS, partial [Pedosphaera sp.]|nr:mutS [Pedosphaera sp.]